MASPFSADWMIYALPWLMRANNSADWSFFWGLVCIIGVFGGVLRWVSPGGWAWAGYGTKNPIPGPRGWPVIGSLAEMGVDAHRRLKDLAVKHNALDLMAVSLGSTRLVISSKPEVAKELLNSSAFADRPLKQSAQQLLFGRAIGFAPYGEYWRNLRRIASNNLFSPKRISSHAPLREMETALMVQEIISSSKHDEAIYVRPFLQRASLNNIMSTVFGKRYNFGSDCAEAHDLQNMVREGFELLGAFNWADHLSFLQSVDPHNIHGRCQVLVPKVTSFVQKIIDEHRARCTSDAQDSDFVDVLLSLKGDEKLQDADMVAVLWEMIFRGTDTTAILTEWIMAEIVLHPEVQNKLHKELDMVVGKDRPVQESDIPNLHYMQAVVKESLRVHPPGPLLSWARLAIHDTEIAGHFIPAGTTAMVNMYSITHDPEEWKDPDKFNPSRFMAEEGGMDVDIKGTNLKLAPFGAGRRVCPGRMLGLATVHLWLARLMHQFQWLPHDDHPVNLSEVLKLSCEMQHPLCAKAIPRLSTKVRCL